MTSCTNCGRESRRPTPGFCHWCAEACDHAEARTVTIRLRSGRVRLASRCVRCDRSLGAIRHDTAPDISTVPVHVDHRATSANPPCSRCGSTDGTEEHHWAPRAIFDDPDAWPTDFLCPTCHTLWHATMRRAGGYSSRR